MVIKANREGDRPGRNTEQVAVQFCIILRQFEIAGVVQININLVYRRLGIAMRYRPEGIKRRGRVRIRKSVA